MYTARSRGGFQLSMRNFLYRSQPGQMASSSVVVGSASRSFILDIRGKEMQHLTMREAALHVRYCFMLPEEFIPEAVLEKDKEFQRVVRKSKQCFARVECQSSWNSYQVRVAATPHNLNNDERSYWITVPPTALPTPMQ